MAAVNKGNLAAARVLYMLQKLILGWNKQNHCQKNLAETKQ
jgi:hypothetical protein